MSRLNLGDSLIMNSDIVVNGGEVKTGATFNGKPVYCDCFEVNVGSRNSTDSLTAKIIPNVRSFVRTIAFNGAYEFPIVRAWANQFGFVSGGSGDGRVTVTWSCGENAFDFGTVRITTWYTKTTD